MLNILYFICLHLFLCIIIKPKNLLSCGLFGFSGDDLPDFKTLKFLGLLNTSRGTDSCGVYYNRKIRKDIASFADELVLADNTPKRNVDHNVYIGHTRSRSVGSVSTSNAHPFLYYTEKSGKDENGNNEYITTFDHDEYYNEVFAHNGTLKNWEELAKETNHDIKDLDIDSKLLGQLVCEDIKKAVTQYTGAAAFLYTSLHGSKSLYAWKGAAGGILERPLHYIKAKEGYYLSSV